MGPIKREKLGAMKTYNKNTNTSSNSAFVVYSLTALICSIVFFSPFWYPLLEPILIISLPNIISQITNPKCLFIISNFIVLFVVGESNLLVSKPSKQAQAEVFYDEYLRRSQSLRQLRPVTMAKKECKKESSAVTRSVKPLRPIRKGEEVKGSVMRSLSAEELSKRADDFIARVNRQRRLEATDLVEWGS